MPVRIVALSSADTRWCALVARRMGETLDEVLGAGREHHSYSDAWLLDRVHHHLDPTRCEGAVFVAIPADDGPPVGHTIVRADHSKTPSSGVFSTTWVHADHRRAGVARALLDRGEAWFRARGLPVIYTDTASDNAPLQRLFERRGYRVVETAPDGSMVRLERSLSPPAPTPVRPLGSR